MKAPQIIIIVFYALSIGVDLANHGKPRTGTNNVINTIIGVTIVLGILWWGGFFK